MITFVPLILLVLLYAKKLGVIKSRYFLYNVFFAAFVIYCSYLEIFILSPENYFPRLDEEFFYLEAIQNVKSIMDLNWRYLIFNLFSHATIATGSVWMLKVQSVPFALLTSLILYDVTRIKKTILFFPFFLGYLYFLSTLNMRDSLLICSMLFFMLKVSRAENIGVLFWSSIAAGFYLFLRPEYSIIWCLLYVWTMLARYIKNRIFIYAIPVLLAFTIFVFFESNLYSLINVVYSDRVDTYLDARSDELATIPLLNENSAAIVRQLITPLPSSKIKQLLFVGPTDNLVIIEIFRIILMFGVYFMLLVLMIHPKRALCVFRENRYLHILFAFSAINTILYSIYGAGGGDTRNKVYPYILLYLMFIQVVYCRVKAKFLANEASSQNNCCKISFMGVKIK